MRKGLLIVLSGSVGVGKSTLSKILLKFLNSRGIPSRFMFIKSFHDLSYALYLLIAKITSANKLLKYKIAPWYLLAKYNKVLAQRLGFIAFLFDVFISIPLKIIKVQLLRLLKQNVICEEYLVGTLTDYLYTLHNAQSNLERKSLRVAIRFLTYMLRKYPPSITIVLDADERSLLERWRKRGYGDPQHNYVRFQKVFINYYMKTLSYDLTKDAKMLYIDTTNKKLHEVIKIIIQGITYI
jgi:thymidylate kinase